MTPFEHACSQLKDTSADYLAFILVPDLCAVISDYALDFRKFENELYKYSLTYGDATSIIDDKLNKTTNPRVILWKNAVNEFLQPHLRNKWWLIFFNIREDGCIRVWCQYQRQRQFIGRKYDEGPNCICGDTILCP